MTNQTFAISALKGPFQSVIASNERERNRSRGATRIGGDGTRNHPVVKQCVLPGKKIDGPLPFDALASRNAPPEIRTSSRATGARQIHLLFISPTSPRQGISACPPFNLNCKCVFRPPPNSSSLSRPFLPLSSRVCTPLLFCFTRGNCISLLPPYTAACTRLFPRTI